MRMIDYPVGLVFTSNAPTGGPQQIGATESATSFVQNALNPFGVWKFQVDYPALKGAMARAFTTLTASHLAGTNCFRFPFRHLDEPGFRELGIPTPPGYTVPWESGQPWAHGEPWKMSKPIVPVTSASAKGAATISLDVTLWNGIVPSFFGIVGHFAVYSQIGVRRRDGNLVELRVWPPVRRAITIDDYATLRPILAARVDGPSGAVGARDAMRMRGNRINMIEVLDETVLRDVTEDYPYLEDA